jgi:hypothetical protein
MGLCSRTPNIRSRTGDCWCWSVVECAVASKVTMAASDWQANDRIDFDTDASICHRTLRRRQVPVQLDNNTRGDLPHASGDFFLMQPRDNQLPRKQRVTCVAVFIVTWSRPLRSLAPSSVHCSNQSVLVRVLGHNLPNTHFLTVPYVRRYQWRHLSNGRRKIPGSPPLIVAQARDTLKANATCLVQWGVLSINVTIIYWLNRVIDQLIITPSALHFASVICCLQKSSAASC